MWCDQLAVGMGVVSALDFNWNHRTDRVYYCAFEELADEIDALREEKQDLLVEEANRAGMKQRMGELEAFLAEQTSEVTDYDEGLVRQLIEKITVYDDHLAFEFKSGLETEVQM